MNKKTHRGKVFFPLFFAGLLFVGCQSDTEETVQKDLTLLVYMVADNNLNYMIDDELNEMEEGYNDSVNIVVYVI